MSMTLTVRDETAAGDTIHSFPLEFPSERITVRELIRERVYQEVQDFNRRNDPVFRGLVQPKGATQVTQKDLRAWSYQLKTRREIDWKEQFDQAVKAFEKNGFFVLVDDKQTEELDQELVLRRGTEVSFVKLVPLVGG